MTCSTGRYQVLCRDDAISVRDHYKVWNYSGEFRLEIGPLEDDVSAVCLQHTC